MKHKNIHALITLFIYFLVIILICLVSYNLFSLVNRNLNSSESHKNSIKVGPILIE